MTTSKRLFPIPLLALTLAAPSLACVDDELGDELPGADLRALEDGLLLHWTFEDRSGNSITDVSGNGRNGTVQGGAGFVSSPDGEALLLDGVDDWVSFAGPRDPALYGGVNGAFTVSARVRVADVQKYNTLCYGCAPLNTLFVGTSSYGARAMAGVFDQASNGLTWPWTTQALSNDAWVEVTMIVEGGVGTRYYLDCALDSETLDPDVGLRNYNSSSLGRGASADRWFAGEVDEFRVWDRALSEAEITQLCAPSSAEGLELHWTFEDRDGNTILDVSGNGRDGTLQGGGGFVTSPVGQAVSLDGVDDFISLVGPRNPELYGGVNGSFTLSSRVRVSDPGKYNTLCFGCGPFNSAFVGASNLPNRVLAGIYDQTTTGLTWPLSSASLTADTWTEVTMVVEGGVGTRYYLDCGLDADIPDPDVGLRDYGSSSVGRGATADRWFDGDIDELRIWNRALSDTEIAELCPVAPPVDEGLELHWTFEDSSGTTILDMSGNGRNGTIQGGAALVASPKGQALSFDGVDDLVSFVGPRNPELYGGVDGAFTVSTRARISDITRVNTLCLGCGPFNALYLGNFSGGGRAVGKLFDEVSLGFVYPTSSAALADDTWVEVTMTVDGTAGARLYLDCALDTELLDADIGLRDYGYSALGQGSGNTWFQGEIDELRVWSRQLSDSEIAALCQ